MKLKLAKTTADSDNGSLTLSEVADIVNEKRQEIFYFDQDNSHKNLVSLVEHFEDKGLSVYLKEVKYGLDESDYMYEVHIL
jgi:type II secretory pathway component GspD/PulD (secretin)